MNKPLAVDLDGTLINTDLFFESAIWYIRKNPFRFFQMCWWFFFRGRTELKIQIEKKVALPISDLPFNENVIQWLKDEKNKGTDLVLVTGASQKYAEQVAEHLNLFSHVFGVCKKRPRLAGRNKSNFLVKHYGEKNFDYIGNSIIDLAVWKKARKCIIANAFSIVIRMAQKRFSQVQILSKSVLIGQNWNLFNKFFSLLVLRISVFIVPVFFVFAGKGIGNGGDAFFNAGLILPGILLFYVTAFLLAELRDLGPHRVLHRRGIFVLVHPYWSLLSIPLMAAALFYIFMVRNGINFSVWWFLIYFVLEYMRWTFRKYSIYYDTALIFILWMWGFAAVTHLI